MLENCFKVAKSATVVEHYQEVNSTSGPVLTCTESSFRNLMGIEISFELRGGPPIADGEICEVICLPLPFQNLA